jgi:hypothetical protein
MLFEPILTVATLAAVIWALGFLLPRAVRERDAMAITSAVLTTALALLLWFLIGGSSLHST